MLKRYQKNVNKQKGGRIEVRRKLGFKILNRIKKDIVYDKNI